MSKKCAVITGATGDIGFAISRKLITQGYKVFALGRDEEKANKLFSSYTTKELVFKKIDVKDAGEVKSFFENLREEDHRLNCLITCAGILELQSIEKLEFDAWDNVIQTNLHGTFNFFPELIRYMQQDRTAGSLIAIGSRWGTSGHRNASAYSASKAALRAFIKSVQFDLIGQGQRAFLISPGSVQGAMSNTVDEDSKNLYIDPNVIGDLILFLNQTSSNVLFDEISVKAYPYDFSNTNET